MNIPMFLIIFGMLNWAVPIGAIFKFLKENDISKCTEADVLQWVMTNFTFQQLINIRAFAVSGAVFFFMGIVLAIST